MKATAGRTKVRDGMVVKSLQLHFIGKNKALFPMWEWREGEEGGGRRVEANRTKSLLKLCSGEPWEYLTFWTLQSRNKLNNYQHLLFLSLFGVTDGFCLQYEKICQNVHTESERSIYKSILWLRYPTVTRCYIVILMRIYIWSWIFLYCETARVLSFPGLRGDIT